MTKSQRDAARRAREKAKAVRAAVAESLALLDAGDVAGAYAAAERAQHEAFDMKVTIEGQTREAISA